MIRQNTKRKIQKIEVKPKDPLQRRKTLEKILTTLDELEHLRIGQLIACSLKDEKSLFIIEDDALLLAVENFIQGLRGSND